MENNYLVNKIENNCDNLEVLDIIGYLLGVVINDVEYMNEENFKIAEDYLIDYDLGNNYYIAAEDLETITSAMETIQNIVSYNKKERK